METELGSGRRRSRKSRSFKVVREPVWLGDDGMEIKRQITGMMRLLNDKMCRRYRRTDGSRESLKLEPQDAELSWAEPGVTAQEDLQQSTWSLESTPKPQMAGQYGTRSRMLRMLNDSRNSVRSKDRPASVVDPDPDLACCTCTCRSTLEAILQELRAVRKLMQTQRESHEKQQRSADVPRPPIPQMRSRKRQPLHKMGRETFPSRTALLPTSTTPQPSGSGVRAARERRAPSQTEQGGQPPRSIPQPPRDDSLARNVLLGQLGLVEPEVQLADDYDVFISKSQLDSILVNYTRSGSLLFRKLVCAFFDDATLANSLPNGKRKRGLNDNRKGLDQNIVGAIKVFTEKYCTANRIEKLPGPRDWVQILQDQIKLARRRLKRRSGDEKDCLSLNNYFLVKVQDTRALRTFKQHYDGGAKMQRMPEDVENNFGQP
ncbi:BEN domain-containing protein 7 [Scleropages formosus]|uniref:BEN domain-containing protein 7 n=1 Tax=Scleropages formosus TaxID=113540 RepID=UPI0008783E7A|nr:BEN domain-containing protein 7 [Scleropages formosus]